MRVERPEQVRRGLRLPTRHAHFGGHVTNEKTAIKKRLSACFPSFQSRPLSNENVPIEKRINMMKTIGVQELSEIIHKTPKTILTFTSRNPELLPPMLPYPGRKVLWDVATVEEWLNGEHQGARR